MIQSIKNWKVEFKKKIKRKNIQIDIKEKKMEQLFYYSYER